MSANPPILTVPPQAPHPNEHIHRYLSSIHPHQPTYAREGERIFRKEQEHGFEEVASHWAKGDSSSAGMWSEVIMGRRARPVASPPRLDRMGRDAQKDMRDFGSIPPEGWAGRNVMAEPSRGRVAVRDVQEQDEGHESETSSANRREQRKLRRREKAAIRRPPEPIDMRKRPPSQLEGSDRSTSRSILPTVKRRRGKGEAHDIVKHFEASNVPVKRLTLKPGTTKGFLHRGATSVPVRPAKRSMTGTRHPLMPVRDENREMSWRPAPRPSSGRPNQVYPVDHSAPISTIPRYGHVRPLSNPPSQSHLAHVRGHLPPPGRTNSTSWQSEIQSRSSRRDVGTLLSPDPAGTPLHQNAFGFTSAKHHLVPSPYAHARNTLPQQSNHGSANSAPRSAVRQRVTSLSLHAPVSPPASPRQVYPLHIENPAVPAPALKTQTVPSVYAALPPTSQARDRKISIHIQPNSVSGAQSPACHNMIPKQTAYIAASMSRPLIHPNFHENPVDRATTAVSEERPIRIQLSHKSPKGAEELSGSLQERPSVIIQPVRDRDQSIAKDIIHHQPPLDKPLDTLNRLWSPPPHPRVPSPNHFNPSLIQPLRSTTKLDVTQDNPFLSEQNPFLASRQHPSYTYDSHPPFDSFSSPPSHSRDIRISDYPQDQYQEHGMHYRTEETGSFVQGFDSWGSVIGNENNEDLRNFWKDRPAVL